MGLLKAQPHGSDETLIFRRLSSEAIANEAHFGDHSLPGFLLPLSGLDHSEHLRLSLGSHLWQGYLPFTSLLFPLLLDHVGEDLGTGLTLSVQQVGWHRSLRGLVVILLLGLSLFMHFEGLLHLDLLRMPLLVVELGLQADHLLGFVGALVDLTALLLPLPLVMVQAVAMPLAG